MANTDERTLGAPAACPPPPQATQHWAPPPPSWATPPAPATTPPPKKRWTTGRILALVFGTCAVVGVVVVAAGVFYIWASATLINASVPTDAAIGSCYDRFESTQVAVPCDGVYHYEVYSQIVYPTDATYPGRLDRFGGAAICEDDFEAYTGQNYWTSILDYSIPFPTEEEWDAGERETVCALHHAELKPLRGSQAQ